jgi:hypothetical protein
MFCSAASYDRGRVNRYIIHNMILDTDLCGMKNRSGSNFETIS